MSTINIHAAVGAGKMRKPWRIREWLSSQGLNMADVGRSVGVSRQVASETINGKSNNRKVLRRLHELGCPAEYISLPKDIAKRG
jgi:transcriptional regulator with XRE-family HTH domain